MVDPALRTITSAPSSQDIGYFIENIIYLELLRRGYSVTTGRVGKLEVDFIAEKANQRHYYQVSLSILDDKTRAREFNSLMNIDDNHDKTILSLDRIDFSAEGIVHMNVIDFLLSE